VIFSRQHVAWGWRGWCPSAATGPYQAGRSKHWLKIKNRAHPAMMRVMERSG
jgi:hypothetical protein